MQIIIATHNEDGTKEFRGVDKASREFGIQKGRVKNLLFSNDKFNGWTFRLRDN